jgi:transposase
MGEAMAFEGSTKAFVFEAYVEHFLAPTLREGQIVVLDDLGTHKTERVRELIEAQGCQPFGRIGFGRIGLSRAIFTRELAI